MPDRLALKRLTRSDLTLFEAKYRTLHAGNQKAINLNADVFVGVLYPSMPAAAPSNDNEIRLALSVLGPGAKPEHRLTRKIIKNPSYKNWRLNGEFIFNPEDDSSRYDELQPDDIAIMEFDGDPVPSLLRLCLVSQTDPRDALLHRELLPLLGSRTMVSVTQENLLAAAGRAHTQRDHPVHALLADEEIKAAFEDAALGGQQGVQTLLQRGRARRVSLSDFANARANAERVGRDGEGLINAFFEKTSEAGIATWMADVNAVSPYDFRVVATGGETFKIDVKSTSGPFENNIHISMAELVEAAEGRERYDLYRVYELGSEGGKLRIARDIRGFAKSILATLVLPAGVQCDGFSIAVSAPGLSWDNEIYVPRPSGSDDEELAVILQEDRRH